MQDHIRDSLHRFDCSEQLREAHVFLVFFGGEELERVVTDLNIHSGYTFVD